MISPSSEGAHGWRSIYKVALLIVVLAGSVTRILYVDRPLDHRLLAPWREADYTQLARNFYRDGLNIFYPQIDWRGDTPGYAEMELPLVPWTGALLYRLFGYHEPLLRIPAAIFGIASLLIFAALARATLPPVGALFATTAFAANPLLVYLGNAMQPEPLMLLLCLIAIALIWNWERSQRFAALLGASAATAIAILAKSPASYLGLVLAYVVLRKLGRRALTDWRILVAALIAILPPLAWYAWAEQFWRLYGNSLGVSNESHFLGLDMLFPPKFIYGLLKWETFAVFTPAGWLLALAALRAPRVRVEPLLVWYAAVAIFYLVTARTSGDDWAFYYHSIAVAPACLLMGAGVAAFAAGGVVPRRWPEIARRERLVGGALAVATIGALMAATVVLIHRRDVRDDYVDMRRCAGELAHNVPESAQIVVHGGDMVDEYGKPVAHNESMMFAWMDRKGFNYGTEELSIETLDRIAARGGRYWMVQRAELKRDRLGEQVRTRYHQVAECAGAYELYDLGGR